MRNVRRKTGERRLDEALKALASGLRGAKSPWMVIGGIAIIARGVRRMTTDIDAVVRGDAVEISKLFKLLARHALRPRIEDAAAFAEKNLVLLLRHAPTGVDIDLSLGFTDFEREAIASSTPANYGSATYPMARAEDLIVFKALAARPKDIEDAATLILMHPTIDLARARRLLTELAELADEPELVEGLDEVIARARAVRKTASTRRAVPERSVSKPKKTRRRAPRKKLL